MMFVTKLASRQAGIIVQVYGLLLAALTNCMRREGGKLD
jgi:hypothetical protein